MKDCSGKEKTKFMTGILLIFAIVGILCGASSKKENNNEDFLAKVDVIPTPKNIVLTRKGVLLSSKNKSDALIIIGHKNTKRLEAAAKAINDRIRILGGKKLPVIKDSEFSTGQGKGKNLILLGNRECNKITDNYWIHQGKVLTASMPPEQGYIIKTLLHRTPWGGSVFVLAGADSIGTYYAAATFRQLIHKKNNNIIGVTASVRDWPDRKKRIIWGRHARNAEDMEYWALYKSTGISCGYNPLYLVDKKPPFDVSDKAKSTIAMLKYGSVIGFRYNALMSPDLVDKRFSFTYSDKPFKEILKEWNGAVVHGGHLFSWSHEKKLRQRFRAISKALKAADFDFIAVHLPDTDPSNYWPNRSPSCKEKWGDDFQSWCDAQAWLINLVRDEIRKLNPEQKIVYIFRPYTSTTIDDVKWRWDLTVKTLLEKMPFDDKSYILVREDIPSRIEAWRKKWNNMKQYYYVSILAARPSPLFASLGRMLGSFMNYSPDDVVWPITYRAYPDPVNVLMTLERQWNRSSNGPGLWPPDRFEFILKNDKPSKPEEEHLLLRACRNIFGYEAGKYMLELYRNGVNPDLAANPQNCRNVYNIADLKPYLAANLEASRKAYSAMKEMIDLKVPVKHEGKRFFPLMYRVALTTFALAEAQNSIFAAKKLIALGKEKDADKILRKGLVNLQKRREELDSSDKMFKDWPAALKGIKDDGHKTWKDLAIETPGVIGAHQNCSAGARIAAEEAAMNGLLKNKEIVKAEFAAKKASEKIASTPTPVVIARRVGAPITIDGKADEEAWGNAVWQGDFVRHNRLLYSRAPTKVAVLYDDNNIYLFFKCQNSGSAPPVDLDKEQDKWSPRNEYVEAFLGPNLKDGFFQLFFSAGGTLGDVRAFMPKSKGGLYQAQSEAEAKAEGLKTAHPRPLKDMSWTSKAVYKVLQDKNSWNLEAAISIASLKQGKDFKIKKGNEWHVNFCRSIPRSGMHEAEYSSLNRGDYNAYWKFPVMKFE